MCVNERMLKGDLKLKKNVDRIELKKNKMKEEQGEMLKC